MRAWTTKATAIATALAVTLAIAGPALGAGLTKRAATDIARDAARIECQRTTGCQTFRAYDVKKLSNRKAVGKIEVTSQSGGVARRCTRKLTMTLDAKSGNVHRELAKRSCVAL